MIGRCFDADVRMEEPTDVPRVPSPLNGEKVAGGRMRGGNAQDSDLGENSDSVASVTTPHPALSPLRGEGALIARSFHVHPQKTRRTQERPAIEFQLSAARIS